ncbi:outer membrane protein assembly factor BamD [Sphingobacterium wenxiniae]|uniref:Beta-barrel assembly machine subunit BamD n=1 Tax=Sphingobacterium wenxiniae TaxID=683125 RepID=A0A1I6UI85_9SPHI|nr:outer membrane protein assembly factor BamD [Sphingobacterium wenxiniae]SFT01007.1 Beta-barrel assembly machine subunit BamD [Sphingobacterium wenxiniae]
MFLNRRIVSLLACVIMLGSFTGCKSKFEKLRASNNIAMKYQEAVKFYENKKYTKALVLFDELMTRYRGQAEAEDLYYFTAYTNYRLKDYTSARYAFKNFATTYPNSPRAEECRFMSAYCFYVDSPRASLDQENTRKAIDELQLFINLYPDGEKAQEAGDLIQSLRDKLELKAYTNAKLYFNMGQPDDYRAAVIAFENMLREYPDTKYAEEVEFLIVKSQYLFAENSMIHRQQERFNDALDYYKAFTENYPESKFRKEADDLRVGAERQIAVVTKRMDEYNKAQEERQRELGITSEEANGTASTSDTNK